MTNWTRTVRFCGVIAMTLLVSTTTYAQTDTSKNQCDKNLKTGIKAWELVSFCGKPEKSKIDYIPANAASQYNVFRYILNETICYYQPDKDEIICTPTDKMPVSFYFKNDSLHKIYLDNKSITDIFLKFHQKIVLGDSEKHVKALWGEPNEISQQTLSIPTLEQTWNYSNKQVVITDGIVTKIKKDFNDKTK